MMDGTTRGGQLYGGENQKMNGSARSMDRIIRISQNFKIAAERMVQNDDLVRLLIDNREECLTDPIEVTNKDRKKAMQQISIIPIVDKETADRTKIVVGIKDIVNASTSEAYIYSMNFDIIVNVANYKMDDYKPRGLAILNEIDNLFSDSKMIGIGPAEFIGADTLKINESLSGFRAYYQIQDI